MILIKPDIPKRHHQCVADNRPFTAGERCFTLISMGKDGLNRQDLCEGCWKTLKDRGLPPSVTSHWQTLIPPDKSGKPLPQEKNARALALLKEAITEGSPQHLKEAYILALYLARKKILILRQELEQLGELIYIYEISATEELLAIKKIDVSTKDIEALQKSLADQLAPHA